MRWIDWIPWLRNSSPTAASLNLDTVLADGCRDTDSARQATALLKRERKEVARQRRNAHRRSGLLTPGRVRLIGRSSRGSTLLEEFQLSSAMRDASAASEAGTRKAEHLAAIEERLRVIDRALAHLDACR